MPRLFPFDGLGRLAVQVVKELGVEGDVFRVVEVEPAKGVGAVGAPAQPEEEVAVDVLGQGPTHPAAGVALKAIKQGPLLAG